jgi:hypothetical protein
MACWADLIKLIRTPFFKKGVKEVALEKTDWEYNREIRLFEEEKGYYHIGRFPVTDSQISIEIKLTSAQAIYNGTLIIATWNTSGINSISAKTYGDVNNVLTNLIKIYHDTSRVNENYVEVYIELPAYSKALFHIQCAGLVGVPQYIMAKINSVPTYANISPESIILPIESGGTNATTPKQARYNLGVSRVRYATVDVGVDENAVSTASFTADDEIEGFAVSLVNVKQSGTTSLTQSAIKDINVLAQISLMSEKRLTIYVSNTGTLKANVTVGIMYMTA